MGEDGKGKKGRKVDDNAKKNIPNDKIGGGVNPEGNEVEGQGRYINLVCPYCGAVNVCYDTSGYDYWRCWNCGGVFH